MIMFILHFFSNDYYYYFSSKFTKFKHFMLYMFEDNNYYFHSHNNQLEKVFQPKNYNKY